MTSRHVGVVLRQLAMAHMRINDAILVPWVFDSDMLRQLLRPGVLPPALVQDVHRWLIARDFHKLWQCEELIQILTSHCLLC